MYVTGGDTLTVSHLEAHDNSHGVHLIGAGSVAIDTCALYDNSSNGLYAINSAASTSSLDYCTVVENSWGMRIETSGSGTKAYNISNSVVTSNDSYGIYKYGSSTTATVSYSDMWGNGSSEYGVTNGAGNIDINPLFVAATTDFELTSNSPARFASSIGTDIGAFPYDGVATPGLYGTLWVDTTLTSAGSPHVMAGDLTVADNVTLTVLEGTTIEAATSDIMVAGSSTSKAEVRIEGTVFVIGSDSDPVTFTSAGSSAGSWYGVHFLPSASGSVFEYVDIDEATYGVWYESAANNPLSHVNVTKSSSGIYVTAGDPFIEWVDLSGNSQGLHFIGGGQADVEYCLLTNNSSNGLYAVNSAAASVALNHCTIYDNGWGVRIETSGSGAKTYTLDNSLVTDHGSYGIYKYGSSTTFTLSNSNTWGNGSANYGVTNGTGNIEVNPLYVSAADLHITENSPSRFGSGASTGLHDDMGIYAYAGDPTPGLYGTLWSDVTLGGEGSPYAVDGDLTVAPGVTLTLGAGAELVFATTDIMGAYSDTNMAELRVQGTLFALGDPFNRVQLSSSGTSAGSWYGVHFMTEASGSVFEYVDITEARYGVRYASTASNPLTSVYVDKATEGLWVEAGQATADALVVTSASHGVHLTGTGGIDLTNSLLYGNSSNGVYATNSGDVTSTFVNSTIDDNGWGVRVETSGSGTKTYNVVNTLVTNNDSYGIYKYGGSTTLNLSYSDTWGNGSSDYGVTNGAGNISTNPLYVGTSNYRLQETSQAIDAGDATVVLDHDLDGSTRPIDGDGVGTAEIDMGAYEFSPLVPGITVVAQGADYTTEEDGGQVWLDVTLDAPPAATVNLAVAVTDGTEGDTPDALLVFTTLTWSIPQTIEVTGQDDSIEDGDIDYLVIVDPASSQDLIYQDLDPVQVALTNEDDDVTAILVDPLPPYTVTESGGQAVFTVVLGAEPIGDVRVDVDVLDGSEASVLPPAITFDNTNWDVPKTVTITGKDDPDPDGDVDHQVALDARLSGDSLYSALAVVYLDVTTLDDEIAQPAGITVSKASVTTSESGGSDVFTVALDSAPNDDVVVDLSSTVLAEATVSPANLLFTVSDWTAQTVTVTGVDDARDDGDQAFTVVIGPVSSLDSGYDGLDPDDLPGNNIDDDDVGFVVSKSAVTTTEAGGTDAFTVALASEPTSQVVVTVASSDTDEATVSVPALTFDVGTWGTPQTVTVTGVDDAVVDGNTAYFVLLGPVTSADGGYAPLDPANVGGTNVDDDGVGVVMSSLSLITGEDGTADTFTVTLSSEPTDDVTVPLTSSDPTEATVSPASLTFNNLDWDSAQVVTVTGVDDDVDDGDQPFTVLVGAMTSSDLDYDGLDPIDPTGDNADDDTAGVTVSESTLATGEDGTDDSFTVVLDTEPIGTVSVDLSSSDVTEGDLSVSALTFTVLDWDTPQTVDVYGIDDGQADGDQTYVVQVGPMSGADAVYAALPSQALDGTNVDDEAGVSAGLLIDPVDGLVTDESGQSATFTVSLATAPVAAVTVEMTSTDPVEGAVTGGASLTFSTSNWASPQTVTVTGVDDDVDDGDMIFLVVVDDVASADAAYDDVVALAPDDVEVTNVDDDVAGITVSPTSGLLTSEQGHSAAFSVVLNSEPTDDVVINMLSTDPGEGTMFPASLTFNAVNWASAQVVLVTGQDDALTDGDIAYTVSLGAAVSNDGHYSGLDPSDVQLLNTDDEAPVIVDTGDTGDSGVVDTDTDDTDTDIPPWLDTSDTDSDDDTDPDTDDTDNHDTDSDGDPQTDKPKTVPTDDSGSCSCAVPGSPIGGFWPVMMLLLAVKRRQSESRERHRGNRRFGG